jgi:hypothetical protein
MSRAERKSEYYDFSFLTKGKLQNIVNIRSKLPTHRNTKRRNTSQSYKESSRLAGGNEFTKT